MNSMPPYRFTTSRISFVLSFIYFYKTQFAIYEENELQVTHRRKCVAYFNIANDDSRPNPFVPGMMAPTFIRDQSLVRRNVVTMHEIQQYGRPNAARAADEKVPLRLKCCSPWPIGFRIHKRLKRSSELERHQ